MAPPDYVPIDLAVIEVYPSGHGGPTAAPSSEKGGPPCPTRTSRATSPPSPTRSPPPTCEVTGTIPAELDGRYLRNGPNPIGPRTRRPTTGSSATAWSTACASVTARPSWYRNRWVRSARRGRGPRRGAPPRARSTRTWTPPPTPTSCGSASASSPSSRPGARPYELTDELDTVGPSDLGGTLPAGFTAHPKQDPVDRRVARRELLVGLGQPGAAPGASSDERATSPTAASSRPPAARWCTTAPSPSGGSSSTTCRSCSTSTPPWPASVCRTTGRPDYPARIGLIDRRDPTPTCGGSTSTPATCSTRSTPTTTATRSCSTSCAGPKMFDGAAAGPSTSGTPTLWRWTIDTAAGTARGRAAQRRRRGVPPHRRAPHRPPPPLRLRRPRASTDRGRDSRGGIVKHDLDRGTDEVLDLGRRQRPERVRVRAPRRRRRARTTAGSSASPTSPTADSQRPRRPRRRRPRRRTRWPGCTSPSGCPSASTATGSPRRPASWGPRPGGGARGVAATVRAMADDEAGAVSRSSPKRSAPADPDRRPPATSPRLDPGVRRGL